MTTQGQTVVAGKTGKAFVTSQTPVLLQPAQSHIRSFDVDADLNIQILLSHC